MQTLTLNYPDDLEQAVNLTPQELESQIRLMAALKMLELGKLSSGKAAKLAGLSRVEFLEICGRYQVSVFNYGPDELEHELRQDVAALQADEQ